MMKWTAVNLRLFIAKVKKQKFAAPLSIIQCKNLEAKKRGDFNPDPAFILKVYSCR